MKGPYTLDTDGGKSILSRNAWALIVFAVLFMIYAFVPPIQDPINSLLGDLFKPVIDVFAFLGD